MADIARALQPTQWSLFTLNLSSSYGQWGLGHLDRDTNEIAECIRYIADYKATEFDTSKVVLMGHSSGSQAALHYLHRPNPHISDPVFDPYLRHSIRPALDGVIIQAPVSDREAIKWVLEKGIGDRSASDMQETYRQLEALMKDAERNDPCIDTLLPLALTSQIYPGNSPISCRRLMSLISPKSPEAPQEDDLFSSDLSDEQLSKTFGMIKSQGLLKTQLMVLFSGADQAVPAWVDKEKMLQRWRNAANQGGKHQVWNDEYSAIIPGASHALSNDDQAEPRKELVRRVLGYLNGLEKI